MIVVYRIYTVPCNTILFISRIFRTAYKQSFFRDFTKDNHTIYALEVYQTPQFPFLQKILFVLVNLIKQISSFTKIGTER